MWSRNCYDWKPQPPAKLIARLARVAASGSIKTAGRGRANSGGEIILLHDGDFRRLGSDRRHVLVALEYWLPHWRDAGIEFVTVDSAAATI